MTLMEIDLNADLGERRGRSELTADLELLSLVTSANIACGFHAGDAVVMRETCAAAVDAGVLIGAHIGYADREEMGRQALPVASTRVTDEAIYQLGALLACSDSVGGRVSYIKPHGALYLRCATDPECAAAVVAATKAVDRELSVLGPPGSALIETARAEGIVAVEEGFIDRGYLPDGELVPRGEPGSVLDRAEAIRQAVELAGHGSVMAIDGKLVPLEVRSLCIHSDTRGAGRLARDVREALLSNGVSLKPFS